MGIASVRKMASEMLKCGESRVRIELSKETEEALTREDVKALIRTGLVWKIQKKGTSGKFAKIRRKQKKRGRQTRAGNRKGTYKARSGSKKKKWIKSIRALRRLIKELKDNSQISSETYTKFYPRLKGGEFRNKKHLLTYLDEHDLLKQRKELTEKPKVEKKSKPARKQAKKPKAKKEKAAKDHGEKK